MEKNKGTNFVIRTKSLPLSYPLKSQNYLDSGEHVTIVTGTTLKRASCFVVAPHQPLFIASLSGHVLQARIGLTLFQ